MNSVNANSTVTTIRPVACNFELVKMGLLCAVFDVTCRISKLTFNFSCNNTSQGMTGDILTSFCHTQLFVKGVILCFL